MHELNPEEARVLGVLVEKAMTTPDQYPLSVNAAVNGANQKSNREPVLALDEGRVFDALESLRAKGLAVRVDTAGSRVHKYRHAAGEALHVRTAELAILAELLLRGPQTLGELRGRASRMHALESLEVTRGMIDALTARAEPLVRQIAPAPGSRAERFVQLLCPDLHPLEASELTGAAPAPAPPALPPAEPPVHARVERLEREVEVLRRALQKLAASLGEQEPFAEPAPEDRPL